MALKDVGIRLVVEGASAFQTQINKAQQQVGGFSNFMQQHARKIGVGMAAMGTAIAGSMALSVKNYTNAGDAVAKMAKRTNFTVETLSELKHAMELSGAEFNSIEKGSRTLSKAIVQANDGLATYTRAFGRLGIDAKKLIGLSVEEQFMEVAKAIAATEDETVQVATAMELFGRTGTALLPLFAEGTEGLNDMMQEAHDLGIVFDEEAAAKAELMKDTMLRLERAVQSLSLTLADTLIPAIQPVLDLMIATLVPINEWLKQHPLLQKVVLGTAVALTAMTVPLGLLLATFPKLGIAVVKFGASLVVMAAKAIATAAALIVQAVAALWAWAAAIPFVGIALGIAGAAAIAGSIFGIKKLVSGLAFGGEVSSGGLVKVGERGQEVVALPAGATVRPTTINNEYNITENYARAEEPQQLDYTLQALAMYTRS